MNVFLLVLSIAATSTVHATYVVAYRYFKFEPLTLRGGSHNEVQLSEFKLSRNGNRCDYSSAVATNPGGYRYYAFVGPEKAIDNDIHSKWFDGNNQPLIIDFNRQVSADAYTYVTADDVPNRDAIAWNLWGKIEDGESWTLLDSQDLTSAQVTGARKTSLPLFTFVNPNPTSTPTAATLPEDWLPTRARALGASEQQALLFRGWEQVQALKFGATATEALQFSTWEQQRALELGATVDQALLIA